MILMSVYFFFFVFDQQCVPSNSLKKSKSLGDLHDVKDITAPDENKKSREAPASTSFVPASPSGVRAINKSEGSLPQKKRSLDDSGKTPEADAKPKAKEDGGKDENAEKKEKEKDPDDKRPDPIKVIVKDVAVS